MGFGETYGEKEGRVLSVLEVLEEFDRFGGPFAVPISIVVHVRAFGEGTLDRIIRVGWLALPCFSQNCQVFLLGVMFSSRKVDPLVPVFGIHPGSGMSVVNLTQPDRAIAVVLEMLVEGEDVRVPLAPSADVKSLLLGQGGIKTSHDGKPGGSADRLLTVSPSEKHTRFGQQVDVGCLDSGGIGTQFRAEIVDGEEENVRPL